MVLGKRYWFNYSTSSTGLYSTSRGVGLAKGKCVAVYDEQVIMRARVPGKILWKHYQLPNKAIIGEVPSLFDKIKGWFNDSE